MDTAASRAILLSDAKRIGWTAFLTPTCRYHNAFSISPTGNANGGTTAMYCMASSPLAWRKQRGWPACPGITPRWAGYHPRPLRYHCCENLWAFPPFVTTFKFTVLTTQRTSVPLAQKRIHYKTTPSLVEHQPRRLYASSFELAGNGTVRPTLGRLELPDPPIRLRRRGPSLPDRGNGRGGATLLPFPRGLALWALRVLTGRLPRRSGRDEH